MSIHRVHKVSLAVLVFTTMVSTGSAFGATCSNATLKGVYGVLATGLNGSGQPASSVYQITADGAGNISGTATKSKNGTILNYTFTGTYSLAKNCTGTTTYSNQDGSSEHDNIVLDGGTKGGQLIQTDSGHVESSFGFAQGTVTCGLTGKKATFAANLTGIIVSTGQVAFVGQLTLDGKGKVSGNMTLSLNGSIATVPVTGTYTENADCTGTAQITPQGFPTANFNSVVVNAGKELLLVETDSGTIVAGTMQQ